MPVFAESLVCYNNVCHDSATKLKLVWLFENRLNFLWRKRYTLQPKCATILLQNFWVFLQRLKSVLNAKNLRILGFAGFTTFFMGFWKDWKKVTFLLLLPFWWGEQDSNLRSSHSRFTVCPRWPLEYLPEACINALCCAKRLQIYKRFWCLQTKIALNFKLFLN